MINDYNVADLQSTGMPQTEINYFFNNPHTLLIQNQNSGKKNSINVERELPNATIVHHFASFAAMQNAFSAHAIPSATKYIIYDPETWSATPFSEQTNPLGFEQKAFSLVHQHGMKLIFTPANDLTKVLAGSAIASGQSKYNEFLNLGIASKGAPYTDMFELQAQQDEGYPGFSSYVSSALNQIRQSNPSCIVLVGIGSNPGGRTVSYQTILNDYASVKSQVSGFWFNMPGTGNKRAQANTTASQFFKSVYDQLHPYVKG